MKLTGRFIFVISPRPGRPFWGVSTREAAPHRNRPYMALCPLQEYLCHRNHLLSDHTMPFPSPPSLSCYQPSICLPRNPAAVVASFISISPNLALGSRLNNATAPMASPSQIIGAIT